MQAPVVRYGDHFSHLKAKGGFTHSQSNRKVEEDSEPEGPQHFSTPHSIVIMPQSPRPNLSVSTDGLVSIPRPRRENASLNSHPQGLMSGHQTLSHFEMARLERDRRDWRELAAFLRTNDPPKSNFMSNMDEERGGKAKKHAAPLKMFRKSKGKKSPSSSTKPLQLPDSAVAARTTKGHWHIAISIPLSAISTFADDAHQPTTQHPRVKEEEERPLSSQPPSYRPASAQDVRRGSISPTPSQNSIHPALRKEQSMPIVSSNRDSEDLNGDAANTMKSYNRQERLNNEGPVSGPQSLDQVLSSSKRSSGASPTSPASSSPLMKRGTFGAVYVNEIDRNNSQRTDPRHSGGTAHSERTLDANGHSRGMSNGSTNSQMPTSIELPRRSSSRPKDSTISPTSPITPIKSSKRRQEGHMNTGSGDSASSAAMIEATEGLQHQLASSMRNAPRTPAPTRALPDLPEVSDDGCSCPNHHHGRSISEGGKQCQPASGPNPKKLLQERQEKVRALRRRDIEAMKAKEKSRRRITHPPATNANMDCAPGCQHAKSQSEILPPRSQARNNLKRERRHEANAPAFNSRVNAVNGGIGLSPIRTIASTSPTDAQLRMYDCATATSTSQSLPDDFLDSLLPSYDYHRLSSAANRHSNISTSVTNNTMMDGRKASRSGRSNRSDGDRTIRTLTPPRSLSPSFASSDEDGVHPLSPHSSIRRQSQSILAHTPTNTSAKRNSRTSFHRRMESKESIEDVKEIKERMKRLERDNERILKTLNAMMGMQQGVKDLCELLAPSRHSTSATQSAHATQASQATLRPMTEGEKAASRTLEPKPLSLRGSPRDSGSIRASQYGDEDMAQRMRNLEEDMEMLGHRGLEVESGRTVRGNAGCDALPSVDRGGWEELSAVEPLMREVRMNARVSHESRREFTDEEELGFGLMEQGC